MDYNEAQRQAIHHKDGPMLVLAGPGSGKTLVITRRTKNLIEEYGIDPRKILVITFTKAAAGEMKERFLKLMGNVSVAVSFGTFHAIFFTILKYAYNYNSSNIISEEQRMQYFREIIAKLDLEIEDEKDFISGVMSEISLVKGERMDLEHYYSMNCSEDIFTKIYKEYDNRLRRANLIDFDDMLILCYELLKEREDILKIWQNRFEYILIDEFQDINKVQYDIITLLAKPKNNLFIVGDDDQSIYRFRGAKPEIMLNFEKDYKDTKKILLGINYRSTKKIVEAAGRVVKNNKNRFEKNITTTNDVGDEVQILTFKELNDQNEQVVKEILEYQKKGIPYSEIAVLFRTNTQPRALLEKMMEYNIPFRMKDSMPNIYEHWIAKNILSYIQIALGGRDRGHFLQIINRPKRYISRECFTNPAVDMEEIKSYYSDKEWMLDRIMKLEYDLTMLKKMNPYAAINYIRKGIGYDEYLVEYANFRRIKSEELLETANEIEESAKKFKTFDEWFSHIEEYGNELKEQSKNRNKKEFDAVEMATMHSSKGLEYQVVFIVDANEGITPHRKALTDADLEEERRMFYVAMTRAKKKLHIYSVKERYNKELQISRFVGEILIDATDLKENTLIEHKMYGPGKIKKNEDGKLIIYFERLRKDRVVDLKFCLANQLLTVVNNKKA
ncbi:ATP-dependent helicase [Anaeromicropila herbilytica]|uniref:DNA 3'-5' helicase n=1 Tax=Anaeromicropila herbilytica TaxID=2785025 RepID=A0A7R7EJQ5_9FIRM|nr:ATP-dependent helicase [Anaeromicropila herbilytica]BCN29717.1 DNA helicase [Anaeromicropila herbilytica]